MGINDRIRKIIDKKDKDTGVIIVQKDCYQTRSAKDEIVNGGVVYDGIVDEDRFAGIIFLLKEATLKGVKIIGDERSLVKKMCEEVNEQDGKEPSHWSTPCYWMEAFKNPNTTYAQAKKCGGNLAEIGIVNIKKTAGEGTSVRAPLDIISLSKEYGEIIKNEIYEIDKYRKIKLVLCGGTFDFAKEIYRVGSSEIENLDCGPRFFEKDGIVFLEFIHPSIRCGIPVSYAYAQSVFSEVREILNIKL